MSAQIDQLVGPSRLLMESLLRASLEGGAALLLVLLICRWALWLPGRAKCWLWRLAYLKLLIALFWATPLQLPVLHAPTETARLAASRSAGSALPDAESLPAEDASAKADPTQIAHLENRATRLLAQNLSRADASVLVVGNIWLIGVFAMFLKLAAQWFAVRRLLLRTSPPSDELLDREMRNIWSRRGLHGMPRLRTGTRITSPVLVGIWSPSILLPQEVLNLPTHQLRVILAHEIAHALRRDIAWRIVASLIESLFFFHPIVWLARRESNVVQEMAADDLAMALTHASPREYGCTLLSIAARGTPTRLSLAAPIITSQRTLERRLIAMRNPIHWSNRRLMLVAGAFVFVGALSLPRWKLVAQEARLPADAPAAQEQRSETVRQTQSPAAQTTGVVSAPQRLNFVGVLRAGKKVQIQARADGFIQVINVKDGDVVKPGQALVALDDTTEKLHVVAAQAEYKMKQTEAARRQEIHDQHAVSNAEMEQSRLDADIAATKLQLAQQELSLMHMAAPIGGVIEFDRAHAVGEYVARGTTLATIFDQGDARLELDLPETARQQVRVGMTVEVTTEAYPGERFTGRLAFISAEASPQTGTVRAAADIANPRKRPLAGLRARVTIVLPAGGEDAKTEK